VYTAEDPRSVLSLAEGGLINNKWRDLTGWNEEEGMNGKNRNGFPV
jgi:hypothetical protein